MFLRAACGPPSGLKLLTSALSTAESFEEKPAHTAATNGKSSGFSKTYK